MGISRMLGKYFTNYNNTKSGGSKLRTKRIKPLLEIIKEIHKDKGYVRIIDIGGTELYWKIVPAEFLKDHNVTITIVNLPGGSMPEDHDGFTFVEADGCSLKDFPDMSFDIAHSNSVMEHVGDWERMKQFASEISRVGNCYFVQTPNYWFPIEPHFITPFFHWLPEPSRMWLVSHFQLGHQVKAKNVDEAVQLVQHARLLNKKMFRHLFQDAAISTEFFYCLPKSFVAIRKYKSK